MKKPINQTADLALDEDFIRRASALAGGRDLNANDFRVLLEAGLQAWRPSPPTIRKAAPILSALRAASVAASVRARP